jgi:hypothetical protein
VFGWAGAQAIVVDHLPPHAARDSSGFGLLVGATWKMERMWKMNYPQAVNIHFEA